jgi:hypothetical protein
MSKRLDVKIVKPRTDWRTEALPRSVQILDERGRRQLFRLRYSRDGTEPLNEAGKTSEAVRTGLGNELHRSPLMPEWRADYTPMAIRWQAGGANT